MRHGVERPRIWTRSGRKRRGSPGCLGVMECDKVTVTNKVKAVISLGSNEATDLVEDDLVSNFVILCVSNLFECGGVRMSF